MSIPGYDAWIFHHPADDRCPECEGTGTVDCETCTGDPGDDDYAFDRYRDDLMDERLK